MRSQLLLLYILGLQWCNVLCQYYGYFIGPITDNVVTVGGNIFAVDKTSIIITNFTHDGSDPGTFIYAGTLNPDGSYTKTGYPLTNIHGIVEPVGSQVGQLLLQFPEGKSLLDVDWIGVLSRRKKKMVGRVILTDTTKMNIPQPTVIGPMTGRGAISGDVIALDSQTIMIKHLVFGGNHPDTYFMVGSGPRPGPFGVKIPNEEGSLEPLGPYKNRTVILTLPDNIDLMSLSWLSIWSHSLQSSFADITIPRHLNIPPATRLIGVTPQSTANKKFSSNHIDTDTSLLSLHHRDQSKLNCEVLSQDVGLQVRWSVVSESIILQVVGDLGNEMYMAFGVKESESGDQSPAQGDVVVGWINSQTGRGGLDDYFLSGSHTCSDGAESCPDTSKPGGQKNVEMLNSVSRDNYTMLTFKRQLVADDIYDTTIRTDQPQEVFWSVGYKKAEKRMKHKPLRNQDPIFIDFGRLPLWNCPGDSDTTDNEISEDPIESSNDDNKISRSDTNIPDDLDSEPSINHRRKFKGKRRKVVKKNPVKILDDFLSPDYTGNYDDYNDYNDYSENVNTISGSAPKHQQNSFSPEEIAYMKQKFEEKLKKDFPQRKDGQKTTLELIPELGQFVEPFFPKGPPPGARPPGGAGGPPPAPATHPPPANDENWVVPSIGCNSSDNTVFYLQIGPAAVKKGNQGLGQFGQAWYVNGDVAPDLYLVRGQKYTFIVEGGLGTDQDGIIHPFYLTSDNEGGYGTKSDYEARMEEIYGGLSRDREGLPVPAIMGRLCLWRSARAPATYATYRDFKSSLKVSCQETGEPGVLRFTPNYEMPSVLYYQSFSEKLLGGKIHLLDQCHETLKSSAGGDDYGYESLNEKKYGTNNDRNYGYNDKSHEYDMNRKQYASKPTDSRPSYNYPSNSLSNKDQFTFQKPRPPPQEGSVKPQSSPKKRKCPRKLESGIPGMPEFEHFPVREIMKEGVSGDDCVDMPFGSFDDWNLSDEDDINDDYDYVQPTRKPLIFKELMNTKPLEKRKYESKRPLYNYENNEVRRKDSSPPRAPYADIPDLPPPDSFPNLFQNLPGPYGGAGPGGFFDSFNTKEKDYSDASSSYSSKPIRAMIERVTTSKPVIRTTSTTITTPTYYERTTPRTKTPLYKRPSGEMIEDINNMIKMYKNKRKRPDVEVSNSGNSGMSVTPDPGYYTPSPYDYYTPRPKSPSPTPYEFYKPSPTTPTPTRPDVSRPKSDSVHHHFEDSHRKQSHPRLDPPRPPFRQSPLQSFFNPFRNIFSFGGSRAPPPPNRRHHPVAHDHRPPVKEAIPPHLPPPDNFPDFHDDTERVSDYEDIMKPHRRKQRPKRPLFDDSQKQEYQNERGSFQDLIENKKYSTSGYMGERRSQMYRKRPSYDSFYDMDYSPSDKQETMTTALTTQPDKTEQTVPSTAFKPQVPTTTASKKYQQLSEIGVFNPGSIESEAGFVPVVPSNGNAPGLAFSIFDNQDYNSYDEQIDRSGTVYDMLDQLYDEYDEYSVEADAGDRGNVVINIPAPVLPYVPRAISRSLDVGTSYENMPQTQSNHKLISGTADQSKSKVDPWDATIMKNTGHHVDMSNKYPNIRSRSGHTSIIAADQPDDSTVAAGEPGPGDNSADFTEFKTVAGADDGLKIRKVHDIHLSSKQLESAGPLLLSVGSSLSYGGQGDQGTSVAVGSVGQPEYLHPQMMTSGTDLAYGNNNVQSGATQDVVYGKVSETPTTPIKTIEKLDERLLEKLSLLEQSSNKKKMEDYVSDLWAIMKNNSGG